MSRDLTLSHDFPTTRDLPTIPGVQYRLEAQKEGIGRAKSQALQEVSPKTAIQNLGKHYKMLYRNALENEPQHQVRCIYSF